MKNILKYIAFITLTIVAQSCDYENYFTPIVDVEIPEHEPKLVVSCNIMSGSDTIFIYVSKSRGVLDTTPFNASVTQPSGWRIEGKDTTFFYRTTPITDTVSNPTIELYRNDVLFTTFKRYNAFGRFGIYYAKPITPIVADGATYKIKVSAAGFKTVEATQKMPKTVSIDTIVFRRQVYVSRPNDPFDNGKINEYIVDFKDFGDEENYYAAYGRYLDTFKRRSPGAEFINFTSFDPLSEGGILPDKTFNGNKIRWRIHEYSDWYLQSIEKKEVKTEVTLRVISKDWFLLNQSIRLYYNSQDNPFAEPVILYSNIKNGYGIFTMGADSKYVFTIKKE